MAWGVARRGKELEFTVAATKEEPHPGWENRVTGGAAYREESTLSGVREQSWDQCKVLGRPEALGSHRLMEAI